MKKWIKILIAIIVTPIVLLLIFIGFYLLTNLQGVIESYQVGDPNAKYKILLASQGSEFKDQLLNDIVQQLESDTVFLSIVDCTSLEKEEILDWNAIVIIHTTQIHGMPKAAKNYLTKIPDLSKVVLVTTSGGCDEVVTEFDVDAVSTASRLFVTDTIAKWAVFKVQHIIALGSE